jgi:hypothetical protein
MDLLRRAIGPWQARRAAEAEKDIRGWHEACLFVVAGCLRGLRDPQLPRSDIGVTLDNVDRALFRVRDAGSGAQQALRRRAPELRARIRRSTEAVVELRNETASFLIRAQGSTPPYLQKQGTAAGQPEAYRRAVQEVGRAALVRSQAVERDLEQLWADLQPLLAQLAEPSAGG